MTQEHSCVIIFFATAQLRELDNMSSSFFVDAVQLREEEDGHTRVFSHDHHFFVAM
jgi:hypothetical protein